MRHNHNSKNFRQIRMKFQGHFILRLQLHENDYNMSTAGPGNCNIIVLKLVEKSSQIHVTADLSNLEKYVPTFSKLLLLKTVLLLLVLLLCYLVMLLLYVICYSIICYYYYYYVIIILCVIFNFFSFFCLIFVLLLSYAVHSAGHLSAFQRTSICPSYRYYYCCQTAQAAQLV